MQASMSYRFK